MSVVSRDIFAIPNPESGATRSIREIARSERIVLLIVALVLMSLADLACTVAYLTSVGMVEVNPIARHMISIGGIRQLVLFKALTIVVSCGCIYFARHRRGAELAAWFCVGILFFLMLHWLEYNEVMGSIGHHLSSLAIPGNAAPYQDWIMVRE